MWLIYELNVVVVVLNFVSKAPSLSYIRSYVEGTAT